MNQGNSNCDGFILKTHRFPIGRFLNISDSKLIEKYRNSLTCNETLGHPNKGCCFCDAICKQYKDCCVDLYWEVADNIETYTNKLLREERKHKIHSCEYIAPSNLLRSYGNKSYLMVTECIPGASVNDVDMCKNSVTSSVHMMTSSIPVVGVDGYVYRNLFCAKCNSVSEFSMVPLQVNCGDRNMTRCELQVEDKFARHQMRECMKDDEIIRTCPYTDTNNAFCHAFKGIMGYYRNYFCYKCNNSNKSNSNLPTINAVCVNPYPPPPLFSWSTILQFSDPSSEGSNPHKDAEVSCSEKSVFDVFFKRCFPFTCPSGYQAYHSKCIDASRLHPPEKVVDPHFDKCLMQRSPQLFLINFEKPIEMLGKLTKTFGTDHDFSNASILHFNDQIVVKIEIKKSISLRSILNPKMHYIMKLIGEKGRIILSQNQYSLNTVHRRQIFPNNRLCATPVPLNVSSINFTSTCDVQIKEVI